MAHRKWCVLYWYVLYWCVLYWYEMLCVKMSRVMACDDRDSKQQRSEQALHEYFSLMDAAVDPLDCARKCSLVCFQSRVRMCGAVR